MEQIQEFTEKKQMLRCALARIRFLHAMEKASLLEEIDSAEDLASLEKSDFEKKFRRTIRSSLWDRSQVVDRAKRDAALLRVQKIGLVLFAEKNYPPLLREIGQPPFSLFYRGNFQACLEPSIAVVGTRNPSTGGLRAAFDFSKECALMGVTVVSGLAMGIDAAAHKGALSAWSTEKKSFGTTVAVCGTGIDQSGPRLNRKLAEQILQKGGCIVSEYPPEFPGSHWTFPERNRIISGLSKGTAVIEAPEKSGSLITADFALEQNRDLFIHNNAVDFARRQSHKGGVLSFVEDGALVVGNAEEACREAFCTGKSRTVQGTFDF